MKATLRQAFVVLCVLTATGVVSAWANETNVWQGSGNASVATNWSLGRAPAATDSILLDGTSLSNMTWDSNAVGTVASWNQTTNYTGTVTVATVYGSAGFTNFTLNGDLTIAGGTWTHMANTTASNWLLRVSVGGDFNLGSNAVINADACGFSAGNGPGGGLTNAGGSYGGLGGSFVNGTYGSYADPDQLGSGGSHTASGGAVYLTVVGNATVDGVVQAGGKGSGFVTYGGGSGGSIRLRTATLGGAGTLAARGASNSEFQYRCGGGGRVAVILTQSGADFSPFLASGTISARGGNLQVQGGPGTIYLQAGDDAEGHGLLVIDGENTTPAPTSNAAIPTGQVWNVRLQLQNRGVLGVPAGAEFVVSNIVANTNTSGIRLSGGAFAFASPLVVSNWSLYVDTPNTLTGDVVVATNGIVTHNAGYGMDLTVAGDLTIQGGGAVSATGKGNDSTGAGATSKGASHGGIGGNNATSTTYGAILAPTNSGSYGNGYGGGAIELTVAGTCIIEGSLEANGLNVDGIQYGAGSGGSVLLTTPTLAGAGTISANGGAGSQFAAAGGAGGRVALLLTQPGADFSGFPTNSITAYGGLGYSASYHGAAGTVYLRKGSEAQGSGSVWVRNSAAGVSVETTLPSMTNPGEVLAQTDWTIKDYGRLKLATNAAIRSLDIAQDTGLLNLNDYTLRVPALTITNRVYEAAVYTTNNIGSSLVTGPGSIVMPVKGTVFTFH